MSTLVESLRQIGRDLVDKRLWPVVVVLLAALVAVPIVIGGSNGDAAPPDALALADPGAAATAPAAPATTARKVATKAKVKAEKGGRIDNPFFDPPKAPAAGAGSAAGAGAAGSAAGATRAEATSPTGEAVPRAAGPAPAKPASGTAKAPAPAAIRRSTPAPAPAPSTSSYLRTVVRVNGADGGKAHPIARLTPLGGTTHPGALFLGVAKAGARYAVFLLGPRATSHGKATCKGATDCRMIGLKAGQTQVVTVRLPSGAVRRFTLRVESIRSVRTGAARARAARAHVHADGRRVVRDMRRHEASAAAMRTARYDTRAGLLRAARAGAVKSASR